MARRKAFELSMDMIYFLTQTAHEYHKMVHGPDTGFLSCDQGLCVTLQVQIQAIVNEAV